MKTLTLLFCLIAGQLSAQTWSGLGTEPVPLTNGVGLLVHDSTGYKKTSLGDVRTNLLTASQAATQIGQSNLVTAALVATQIGSSNLVTSALVATQIGSSNLVTSALVAAQIGQSNLLSAGSVSHLAPSYATNVFYTNTSSSTWLIIQNHQITSAAIAGGAAVSVYVDGSQVQSVGYNTSASGPVTSAFYCHSTVWLPPGSRVAWTNVCTGAGNTIVMNNTRTLQLRP